MSVKRSLLDYARALLAGQDLSSSLDCPVLLWESGERSPEAEPEQTITDGGQPELLTPRPGNPIVMPLRAHSTQSQVASIALGRSESNDIVIENGSVSRLHALIHRDTRTSEWTITDTGSRNGTWVDGIKLQREQTAILKDGMAVRLGDAHLRFFLPGSFAKFVATQVVDA